MYLRIHALADSDDEEAQEEHDRLMRIIGLLLDDDDDESPDCVEEGSGYASPDDESSPRVKKTRLSVPRKDPKTSGWWHDLQRQRRADCPRYYRKRWLQRFRIPIDTFDSIIELFEKKGWYDEVQRPAGSGAPAKPFELKLMGALRYLGRGEVFDTISECCDNTISSETFRIFTRWFCFKMYSIKDEYIRAPDPDNKEEMTACMKPYTAAGVERSYWEY